MSYILDALKKADAERERGTVPGLHSQPMAPTPDDDDEASARGPLPIVWIGAGVALCLIGVLSWQLLTREPAAPSATGAAPADATPPAGPNVSNAPAQPPQAEMQPQAQTMQAPQPQPTAPSVQQPPAQPPSGYAMRPPAPPPETRTHRAVAEQRQANVHPASPTTPPTTSPAAPPAATPSQRIPTLQELPDDVRRDIPQLTIGGAMYSETPASRMLIINSQVFHEGDKPYQGLTLEEIRLKSAVFSYRGYRYSINY
jgi:general secretion pathway protein B